MDIERYTELRAAYLAYQKARKALTGATYNVNKLEEAHKALNAELEFQGWETF